MPLADPGHAIAFRDPPRRKSVKAAVIEGHGGMSSHEPLTAGECAMNTNAIMKRILIFCVLGTLLSLAGVIVPAASPYKEHFVTVSLGLAGLMLLPCMALMAIASGVDWAMSGWGWQRIAVCAAVVYALVTMNELMTNSLSFEF